MPTPPFTRRAFLRTSLGAGCVLAGAFATRSLSTSAARDEAETIKVGLLHSLTGFLALTELPQKDAELLAIEEINKAGGVLGKRIEPVIADTQSKLTEGYPE